MAKTRAKATPKPAAEKILEEDVITTADVKDLTEYPVTVEEATAPENVISDETPESIAQAEADHKEAAELEKEETEVESTEEKPKGKKAGKSQYVIDEEKIAAYLSATKFPDKIVQIQQGGNYVSSANLEEIYVPLSLFKA